MKYTNTLINFIDDKKKIIGLPLPSFMKILLHYLSRYKGLVAIALVLAAVNQVFSLLNPYILGHYIIDTYVKHASDYTESVYVKGILIGLTMIISAAMISRIAKAFQDYVVAPQKVSSSLFTNKIVDFV